MKNLLIIVITILLSFIPSHSKTLRQAAEGLGIFMGS